MQIKRGIFHRLLSLRLLRDTQMMAVNNIFFFILIASAMRWHDKEFENGKSEQKRKKSSNPSCLRKIVFASNAKLLLTRLKKPFVESTSRLPSLDTTASCDVGEIPSFFSENALDIEFQFFIHCLAFWCDAMMSNINKSVLESTMWTRYKIMLNLNSSKSIFFSLMLV